MDITPAEFGLLKDQIELMEVTTPAPGQALTTLQMRRCYGRLVEDIRVDSAALAALISEARAEAMATDTEANADADAVGHNDLAMAFAVLNSSYTTIAAAASSSRPLRARISKRPSIGSALMVLFMGAPVGMGVVRDAHRKPARGTHPVTAGA